MAVVVGMLAVLSGEQIAQWVYNALVGLAFLWIGFKTRKFERMEDRLETLAAEKVAHQISLQTQPLLATMKSLDEKMNRIDRRLDDNEEDAENLLKGDHAIELKLEKRVGEAALSMAKEMATKEDVREVRDKVDNLATKREVQDMSTKVLDLERAINSDCVQRIEQAAKRLEAATRGRPN